MRWNGRGLSRSSTCDAPRSGPGPAAKALRDAAVENVAVQQRTAAASKCLPGLALCFAIAIVAFALGRALPVVGGPVFGIVLGMVIAVLRRKRAPALDAGIAFSARGLLQFSIILLGANLELRAIVGIGLQSLPVMLGTLVVTLTAAYGIGRLLGIERDLRRLLGVGTAICGGSAIAALSSVLESSPADVAYSIATVFLFNIVAVLVFPALGHLMGLSQHAFGLWAGTAINDTSSVVAAGFAYGHIAGNEGVIVKLTRTTLIIPIVLFYAARKIAASRRSGDVNWKNVVPWFVLWFSVAALLNTFGVVPQGLHSALGAIALFLIVVALCGVGLGADFARMRAAGWRPLLLGGMLWILIAASSLAIAHFSGHV